MIWPILLGFTPTSHLRLFALNYYLQERVISGRIVGKFWQQIVVELDYVSHSPVHRNRTKALWFMRHIRESYMNLSRSVFLADRGFGLNICNRSTYACSSVCTQGDDQWRCF